MTSPAFPLEPEALLADSAWLRVLARGLVRDAATADDVAQEAWLIALRAEPAAGVERRTWLTGVLRNVAWKHQRAASRRTTREERGARTERLPETAELVARAEMQRVLSDAVVALDEPFRTTILLRYLEDLTSAEIARRQSVPEGTVRWRVQRGLELLRAELEARRGSEWLHGCALLGGLARLADFAASTAATSAPLASTALSGAKGAALSAATSAKGATVVGTKAAALSAASTSAAVATAGASSSLASLPAALLAASLVLGGGATAISTGWIEAPWSETTNRTASGSEDFVHASARAASLADDAQATSPVEVEGGARATTPPRTPLAVRTELAPEGGATAGPSRTVRIERRMTSNHAVDITRLATSIVPEPGAEKQVFVLVGKAGELRSEALADLDEDLFDDALTDDERAEVLARVTNRLAQNGRRVFAGKVPIGSALDGLFVDAAQSVELERADVTVDVNVLLEPTGARSICIGAQPAGSTEIAPR